MSLGKASIRRAANADTKKSTGIKAAGGSVTESVISPMNAEEIQLKFLSGNTSDQTEDPNRPVRITDRMPDYLL